MEKVDRPARPTKALIARHPKCGKEWTGLSPAHCTTCCLTFTSNAGFDKHRLRGQCVHPSQRGLVEVTDRWFDCWGFPGDGTRQGHDDED